MRIIAGRAGGITIKAPRSGTRPTSERVREAVFSMLGGMVSGARVLDLFAGSGAMGLEALSRGAREVCFIESDARACAVIADNLRRAKLEGGRVVKSEASTALRRLAADPARFDLVMADPPYAKDPSDDDRAAELLGDANLARVLTRDGWLLLESTVTRRDPRAIVGWRSVRDRAYGSTRVRLLQRVSHAEIPDPAAS